MRARSLTGACLTGLLAAGGATAQTTSGPPTQAPIPTQTAPASSRPADAAPPVGEVVVTANKRAENVQNVAGAVQPISADSRASYSF